ncbi:MAG: ribbon-helix-helix protein, CopG family [bacterium]
MRPRLKTRITLSLNSMLISAIDNMVKKTVSSSRSAIIEQVLQKWCDELYRIELDNQTERYYHSLSHEEKEEDQQWIKMSSEQIKNIWD